MTPRELAAAWYWTEPPRDWLLGMGDVFRPVLYYYRDKTGLPAAAPVAAISTQHPCDIREGTPARVNFARVYQLGDYISDNPHVWQSLGVIWQGSHFDFCLLPAFPGKWDLELIVDLTDQFPVDRADLDMASRLAGLQEGYWQTFGWYVARRAGRAGFPVGPPSFETRTVRPEEDSISRLNTIPARFFEAGLRSGEAELRPEAEPPLVLTHLLRQEVEQHWWRAQWKGITRVSGYGLSQETAIESLVRAVRRLAFDLPGLRPEAAGEVRAALSTVGLDL